jgi:hypothetical protein
MILSILDAWAYEQKSDTWAYEQKSWVRVILVAKMKKDMRKDVCIK